MLKVYKYRIYPTNEQIEHFVQSMGCVRYLYNKALEAKIKHYETTGKSLTCFDLITTMLVEEKKNNEWLKIPYSQCLQMPFRNLDNAFQKFFRKISKFPTFKKKHSGHQSIQYSQNVRIDFKKNILRLPKIGNVKIVIDREFNGKIKTCTVSKTPTNKFFISILVDDGKELPIKQPINETTSIGIDLGIKDFAILSNREKISNPKFLGSKLQRLKVLQRRASKKKKKGSNNRKKANLKVAKLYEKVTNQRADFLHKTSTKLIRENQTIILEDLNIAGMMKNHCLARVISDVSWAKFITMLQYKSEWYGKNLVQIGRFEPSSKMCSCCGTINRDLTLKNRFWTCEGCKAEHDRDVNAAINIKKFGLIGALCAPGAASPNYGKNQILSRPERSAELVEMPEGAAPKVRENKDRGDNKLLTKVK